ncbi:MAG: HTH-type transcriptional regulator RutR [Alphaproteobacteria bacterium]
MTSTDFHHVSRASQTKKRTRIQAEKEATILDAALAVFSTYGFRGATIDQIAARAGMTKPNLLYYFRRKRDIYLAVLQRTLDMWLQPLEALNADGDPHTEIQAYLDRKLELSRDNPLASRLFALEVLQGAPVLIDVLTGQLKLLVDQKAAVISRWADEGRIAHIDPHHLIFMIWATTQHYADFEIQIRALLGDTIADRNNYDTARTTLSAVFMGGINVGRQNERPD